MHGKSTLGQSDTPCPVARKHVQKELEPTRSGELAPLSFWRQCHASGLFLDNHYQPPSKGEDSDLQYEKLAPL